MEVVLTHVGGPTVLIEIAGWRLLTDPTFDPPGRSYRFGWGTGSRKLTGPAIAASDLGPIDAVLLSHDHHDDNLDAAGRALLPSAGAVITTAPGAKRLGGDARGLEPWATTRLEAPARPPIEITATPCRHGPPLSRPIVGDVIGFALRWDGQEHGVLWISGDTVLYDGVRQVADRLQVGTALLHLGGVRFPISGPARYTMTAKEAVELCRLVEPRTIIPILRGVEPLSRRARGDRTRARLRTCGRTGADPMAADRRCDRAPCMSGPDKNPSKRSGNGVGGELGSRGLLHSLLLCAISGSGW
jgi:L-ascorbate metabolism protein UlaG (beta-lactamase superfamily)